jgi:hypothetical protein
MSTLRKQLRDCEVGDYCPLRLSSSREPRICIAMPKDPKDEIDDLRKAEKQGLTPTANVLGILTEEWVFERWEQVDGRRREWVWKRVA